MQKPEIYSQTWPYAETEILYPNVALCKNQKFAARHGLMLRLKFAPKQSPKFWKNSHPNTALFFVLFLNPLPDNWKTIVAKPCAPQEETCLDCRHWVSPLLHCVETARCLLATYAIATML